MPLKALKGNLSSLAGGFTDALGIENPFKQSSAMDAGKMAAVLTKKSPFEIPEAPDQLTVKNPLSFNQVQYPLDLGSTELGHWMIFESGFEKMSTRERQMTSRTGRATSNSGKITSKTPAHSITTSGIALYMPPDIKTTYSQSYEQDETGMSGDIEAGIKKFMDADGTQEQMNAALEGVIGPVTREVKKAVGELSSVAGLGDPFRLAMKRGGKAINPRNEMFYNTPEMRTFSFTFDFWPRNPEEADAVDKIIHIFKYNSAPGLDGAGSIFSIPNYFHLTYMRGSGENKHLHRFQKMYCTSVSVDYAPDGQATFLEDGHPVHTKLTLAFTEDAILTKGNIEGGM